MERLEASDGAADRGATGAAAVLARLVEADGAAAHRWCARLTSTGAHQRDLDDAVHALCLLHGQQPGLAEAARERAAVPAAAAWLDASVAAFAAERVYLARLAAAAGPLPSTPGHAESHAAITGQHHALDMLARSERGGCSLGAVAALVGDWASVRRILDAAAGRYAVAVPPSTLPTPAETLALVARVAAAVGIERAIGFGAQQLLAQHRGLWSLLEARAEARDRS